ncbi:MAG: hypothetical protein ICV78_00980 [Tolypothrix sp. Co-bin9]|nr:hypothetical protein [Tolypothrix sp. Co-bin9]
MAALTANHLEALLTPVIFAQQKYYKQLRLRDRVLNLSLMVAAVLTLLWRQVPGVQELNRLLGGEMSSDTESYALGRFWSHFQYCSRLPPQA